MYLDFKTALDGINGIQGKREIIEFREIAAIKLTLTIDFIIFKNLWTRKIKYFKLDAIFGEK